MTAQLLSNVLNQLLSQWVKVGFLTGKNMKSKHFQPMTDSTQAKTVKDFRDGKVTNVPFYCSHVSLTGQ